MRVAAALALLAVTTASSLQTYLHLQQDTKNTSGESAPNPIALDYPNSVTGTINGTISVVPIPLSLARSIIPAQYGILQKAYKSFGLPLDTYPMIVRTCLDHDIQIAGIGFSLIDWQLVKILFPFVDLLGDGHTSFAYQNYTLVTASNTVAQGGISDFGQVPAPATFVPDLEAYAGDSREEITFEAYRNESLAFRGSFVDSVAMPWGLDFYMNVTNQPIFGNGTTCVSQINFFNTTLSTGDRAPAGIVGRLDIKAPMLPSDSVFETVFGLKVDIAFLQNPRVPCGDLQGYTI